jgi:hypothetical protein
MRVSHQFREQLCGSVLVLTYLVVYLLCLPLIWLVLGIVGAAAAIRGFHKPD